MSTHPIQQPDPEAKGEHGPAMKGADVLVHALEREGVDIVFAYPGGASMELHQSLTRSQKIRTILPLTRTRRRIYGSWLCPCSN